MLYQAGDLVTSITTDGNAEAEVKGLYLGKYYLKETKAPEGYLPDPEEHEVVCSYEGDQVPEVERNVTSDEQVYRQPFQLIKLSDNGEATEAPTLAGAGFNAYLKSSLKVLEDGSYDLEHAEKVALGKSGETTLYTDEKGYLATQALPYGTYVVKETVVPHNVKEIRPFEVSITEHHPDEPQVWRIFIDREFAAKLRIVKKDRKTGKTVLVPNAEFKVYDLNRKEYVTQYTTYPTKVKHSSFFTDGDGDLILPEMLKLGDYRIEEVAAPEGYVVNEEPVFFSVDTDTAYETDPDTYEAVITAECVDAPVTGELTIEKKGELLEAYRGGLFAGSEDKEFIYREGSLSGAEFEVYAAEDIYTNDGQKNEAGERIRYYKKGERIATLMTDETGRAVLSGLPLGTYQVKETKAPYGYVLNPEEQTVTFAYVDDRTPVINETLTVADDRQTLSLSVFKNDAETGLPVSGAVFGLYAAEEIRDAEGNVLVEADTLLERAVSGSDGKAVFKKDYPLGQYYAEELQAPDGYVSSDAVLSYDASYQGQETAVLVLETELKNVPTRAAITKADLTSGAELSGATLSVFDEEGNLIETWTSEAGNPHVIERLHVGETYTLKEEFAPYGYLQAEEIRFTVSDTGELQKVEMQDAVPTGTILLNKDGEFLTDIHLAKGHWYDVIFQYFRKSLAGVTFEVYAAEDILSPDGLDTVLYGKDTLVSEIVTNDKGIAVLDGLPLGRYYLIETKTLEGFVLDQEPIMADLSYIDQHTPVVYAGMAVTNERQKVQITVAKTDAETGDRLEGAVFGLYAAENMADNNGQILVEQDDLIEKAVTGADGTCVFQSDLPLGRYYVKEIQAPAGYVWDDQVFDLDAAYRKGMDVIELEAEFENVPTKLQITKTDITGDQELAGAVLSILDKDGNVVETWKSGKEPHYIERIPTGDYILREETAPYGYRIATDVSFTVEETGELQKVSMKDELVKGRIVIEKTDAVTGEALANAVFEIRDKDGRVLETLVTGQDGCAESGELDIAVFADGEYQEDLLYLVMETKAPDGYVLDGTIHEVTLRYDGEAPEQATAVLELSNQPEIPEKPGPKTGDIARPWLYAGLALAALAIGTAVFKKRKD